MNKIRTAVGRIRDEKGAALVVALMIMVIMTLLGFAAILTSNVDVMISGNERATTKAQYVAEAGLADAIRFLNVTCHGFPNNTSSTSTSGAWAEANPNWQSAPRTVTMPDGFTYTYTLSFKQDTGNLDNNPATPVVCYDQTFKYASPAPINGGYPVVVIDSTAIGPNNNRCDLEVEITKNYLPIGGKIKGAATCNGGVDKMNGNSNVSGYNYYPDPANPGSWLNYTSAAPGKGALPGIVSQGTVDPGGSATTFGTPTATVQNASSASFIKSVGDALGLSETEWANFLDGLNKQHRVYTGGAPPAADLAQGGVYYVEVPQGQTAGDLPDGKGIYICHNPNYVPQSWMVSDKTNHPSTYYPDTHNPDDAQYYDAKLDTTSAQYDSSHAAACQPYTWGNLHGHWQGVVIGDVIQRLNANASVYGAVLTLGMVQASLFQQDEYDGTADIYYSSWAVEHYASGQYIDKKLSWRKKTSYQ